MESVKSLTILVQYGQQTKSFQVNKRSMIRDYEQLQWFLGRNCSFTEPVKYAVYWKDKNHFPIEITTECGYQTFLREHENSDAMLGVKVEPIQPNQVTSEGSTGMWGKLYGRFFKSNKNDQSPKAIRNDDGSDMAERGLEARKPERPAIPF
ncbi:uncharacterized protein LOC118507351 [Anopheles stephensi]|uniref:uncharacterized protein LOC118507351 n=1 Tax=Anopheles stephensi TaxID=30069 RepID=UPI001658899D|nr:uncharacterized protein LOC118507351 [Anopheles stephensi]